MTRCVPREWPAGRHANGSQCGSRGTAAAIVIRFVRWPAAGDARDRCRYFKRCGIQAAAFEGLHVKGMRRAATHLAGVVHFDDDGGDFQQRIGTRVEAAGFYIHDDGQEAAKAAGCKFR